MTPEQFCYWLQGRAEMQPDTPPSAEEWQMIRDHLATVFNKVTPARIIPNHTPPAVPNDHWWNRRVECKAGPNDCGHKIAIC